MSSLHIHEINARQHHCALSDAFGTIMWLIFQQHYVMEEIPTIVLIREEMENSSYIFHVCTMMHPFWRFVRIHLIRMVGLGSSAFGLFGMTMKGMQESASAPTSTKLKSTLGKQTLALSWWWWGLFCLLALHGMPSTRQCIFSLRTTIRKTALHIQIVEDSFGDLISNNVSF